MNVLFDTDARLAALGHRPVSVIGYGNQGAAHARNLRDSGVAVVIGQRAGPRFEAARTDRFEPLSVADAVREGALVILALPDDRMQEVFERDIRQNLTAGHTLGFIHGFNIHYKLLIPPPDVDVVMVAPKGPGRLVRSNFVDGGGVAGLIAVHQNVTGRARDTALAWARGIGCTRVGVMETTFEQETVADLFGEQAVLCGGMVELMKAAFETLVAAGYPAELAYFECVHEVKQIVDLMYEGGLEYMREKISSTARFGGLERGPQMVPAGVRAAMQVALEDIRSGAFAERFVEDARRGGPLLSEMMERERACGMNRVRAALFAKLHKPGAE